MQREVVEARHGVNFILVSPAPPCVVALGLLYCHSLVLPYSHSPILPYPPPQNEVQNVQMQLGVAGSESMACALYSMYNKYNMVYSMYKYNMVYSLYKYNMVYSMYTKYNMVYSLYKYNMVYSMCKYNMVYSMYMYNMVYSMYKYNMVYSMYNKYNMVYNMYSTKCSKHVMCFCTCN